MEKYMEEAIGWADRCKPKDARIPKVGAIIAIGDKVIGRGRRGSGEQGDDDHAELEAINEVEDRRQLPEATLYTTLEPCTPEVRTEGLKCCTELILRYKFQKVFIGTLDPNQGVTGKGLLRLQENNVDVELFPHALAQKIRAINVDFIRSQQMLGATFLAPKNRDVLPTTTTRGRHTIRIRCNNPPTDKDYLFLSRNGLYWPQPGPFRPVALNEWEIDAHFGTTGEHGLHIGSANELGKILIDYYRSVIRSNLQRYDTITKTYKLDYRQYVALLGGDYFGIPMAGLGKGLLAECSVVVKLT
jgi:pyrimidine deaminase RibD-like protein